MATLVAGGEHRPAAKDIRLVIAEQNPGVANWVERLGHDRGYLQFRWQRLAGWIQQDRQLVAVGQRVAVVVDVLSLRIHKLDRLGGRKHVLLRRGTDIDAAAAPAHAKSSGKQLGVM